MFSILYPIGLAIARATMYGDSLFGYKYPMGSKSYIWHTAIEVGMLVPENFVGIFDFNFR